MPFDPTLPHPLPEIDPELFDELLSESKRFVDSCDCRVMSDELPTRFLDFWLMPDARTDAQREHYQELYESDENGILLQLPLYLLDHVYHCRFDAPTDDAGEAAMSADAPTDVAQRLESDPEYRADIMLFIKRLHQFQLLLQYIHMMYELGHVRQMYRFDVFDVEAYDEVIMEIMRGWIESFIEILAQEDDTQECGN